MPKILSEYISNMHKLLSGNDIEENVLFMLSESMIGYESNIIEILIENIDKNKRTKVFIERLYRRLDNYRYAIDNYKENIKNILEIEEIEELKIPPLLYFIKFTERDEYKTNGINREYILEDKICDIIDYNILFRDLQCKKCGLRFSSAQKVQLGIHLEEHKRRERAKSELKYMSRELFTPYSHTISNIKPVILTTLNEIDIKEKKIVTQRKNVSCNVCMEYIDVQWDDDEDNWVMKDAVEVKKGEYSHRKCIF